MENAKKKFLEAYDAYADAIYRHCYFRVHSKERAEELMQDTFMKAWQYLARGNEAENIRALLYRIATNLVIDDSRRHKEGSLEALLENDPLREPADKGREDLENASLVKQIVAEMQALDEDERRVLTLRFLDDLDPKEIAEVLGISANNVSVKINRAVKKLRTKFDAP